MIKRKVILGVITGVHGIQGEVKLKSFTADPEAIATYGPLDGSNGQSLTIRTLVPHKGFHRARIQGVDDRNSAEMLKGVELSIVRDRLPETEQDEVYHADLIGLAVLDYKGQHIGTVENIVDFGAGELLEYKPDGQQATLLIPFDINTVPKIDLDAGTLTIAPPEEVEGDSPNRT